MKGSADGASAGQRRVLNVLELVLELDPALRSAYLETLGRQHPALRQQVLAVLRALGGLERCRKTSRTRVETRGASLEMPERVGAYKVIREIGRGGMSRVYLAERADDEFERQVALKVIDHGPRGADRPPAVSGRAADPRLLRLPADRQALRRRHPARTAGLTW